MTGFWAARREAKEEQSYDVIQIVASDANDDV